MEFLDRNQISSFGGTEYLIEDIIPKGGLLVPFGKEGSHKSIWVVDIIAHINAGFNEWNGYQINSDNRPAIYVCAEGASGANDKLNAWEIYYGKEIPFFMVPEPVNLFVTNTSSREEFIDRVAPINPCLVVFDTLARCMEGGSENDTRDMTRVINNVNRMQRELNATIGLVHHARRRDGEFRGSSALSGAADTMIKFENSYDMDNFVTITCEKQKDREKFLPMHFREQEVEDSIILEPVGSSTREFASLSNTGKKILNILQVLGSATAKEITARTLASEKTVYRVLKNELIRNGLVDHESNIYSIRGSNGGTREDA